MFRITKLYYSKLFSQISIWVCLHINNCSLTILKFVSSALYTKWFLKYSQLQTRKRMWEAPSAVVSQAHWLLKHGCRLKKGCQGQDPVFRGLQGTFNAVGEFGIWKNHRPLTVPWGPYRQHYISWSKGACCAFTYHIRSPKPVLLPIPQRWSS